MTTFMVSTSLGALIGILVGGLFSLLLIGFDLTCKRFNLRSFNIATLGMFIGYFMGKALVLLLTTALEMSQMSFVLQPQTLDILKISLFLFGTYLGAIMTLRAADELYVSIPFVRFAPVTEKKKDLILDSSVVSDARIIDVANTGLLDHQLVIPRFVIKDLYAQAEIGDEFHKARARRSLEVIKKLEAQTTLELRVNETDFPDVKDIQAKILRLARLLDANLLSADISKVQMASIEGVRIINIHTLSNALKPLMQAGEYIKIKIQRYGKEPRQGVGYLDDGTMVVVNGGGSYIGEVIDSKVLSVKHTSSGRMIFCNAVDEENLLEEYEEEALHDSR
ncbi:MAG: hypothetical protein JSS61_05770 [Verrucomicrobia bacterium]|nr:hypothetical protein [Verrucomicrobiota bacterium]